MTSTHAIETLCLDCGFAASETAWQMQPWLSEFFNGPARRAIEDAFDCYCDSESVWQLDSLDVDLGVFGSEDSMETWARRLRDSVFIALEKARYDQVGTIRKSVTIRESERRNAPNEDFDTTSRVGNEVKFRLIPFAHYLRRGYLPWSSFRRDGFDIDVLLSSIVIEDTGALLDMLFSEPKREGVLQRLCAQGRSVSLSVLLHECSPEIFDVFSDVLGPWLRHLSRIEVGTKEQIRQLDSELRRLCFLASAESGVVATNKTHLLPPLARDEEIKGNDHTRCLSTLKLSQRIGVTLFDSLGYDPLTQTHVAFERIGLQYHKTEIANQIDRALRAIPGTSPEPELFRVLGLSVNDADRRRIVRTWQLMHAVFIAKSQRKSPRFFRILNATYSRFPEWVEHTLRLWSQHRALRRNFGKRVDSEGMSLLFSVLSHCNPLGPKTTPLQTVEGVDWTHVFKSIAPTSAQNQDQQRSFFVERVVRFAIQGQSLPRTEIEWIAFARASVHELLGSASPNIKALLPSGASARLINKNAPQSPQTNQGENFYRALKSEPKNPEAVIEVDGTCADKVSIESFAQPVLRSVLVGSANCTEPELFEVLRVACREDAKSLAASLRIWVTDATIRKSWLERFTLRTLGALTLLAGQGLSKMA
jgi:Contractile injection system tape measure protein